MVVAPREAIPPQPRNVLAWTHGTWGVVSRCAPSLSPNFWTVTPALDAVKRGYVVVAPDYPGLGSDGVHPFLVGVDTGRSVLDGVRAARQIAGAAAGSRLAVWGESQGGHAALWTGQVAQSYAPGLQLVGVAAAAPPTDLVQNLRLAPNKNVQTFFTAYIGYSWNRHYGAPLATFGGPQTRGILTRLAQNNCIELHSKPKLSTILGILTLQNRLKNVDLGRVQPWAGLARRNSPSSRGINYPLMIAQNPEGRPCRAFGHAGLCPRRLPCRDATEVRRHQRVGACHQRARQRGSTRSPGSPTASPEGRSRATAAQSSSADDDVRFHSEHGVKRTATVGAILTGCRDQGHAFGLAA